MAEARAPRLLPSQQLILVIDFLFEFLKRAVLVGGIQYAANALKLPLLGMMAFPLKILLALWAADKAWTALDYFNKTDEFPRGSFHWWFRLSATAFGGLMLILGLFQLFDEVFKGQMH